MDDDLTSFLKRAAQQFAQAAKPEPPQVFEAEIVSDRLVPVNKLYDAEMLTDDDIVPIESVSESVSSHVQSHLNTSEHGERVSHLGERVGLADEKMESHLHQVFDHNVGHLGTRSVTDAGHEAADAIDPYAEKSPVDAEAQERDDTAFSLELAQMLRNPRTLRQAVLLSEILARPVHRW